MCLLLLYIPECIRLGTEVQNIKNLARELALLLLQFNFLEDQGTRIIIYNLWEDDQGSPELDFDSDEHVGCSHAIL